MKRLPTERRTSALAASSFPDVDAVSPIVSAASGCSSSIAPLPFQVVTTAAPSRSASAVSSALALGRDHAASGDDHRAARAGQERSGPLDIVCGGPDAATRLPLHGVRHHDVRRLGLDVHREVQQDRARAARHHRVPRAVEHERELVHARRLPPLLDDRFEDARVVGGVAALQLLEKPVSAQVRVRRACHERDRRRIDIGGAHPDDGIGGTRPDAREREDGAPGRAVVPVGEVHGRLLVHHLDGPDGIAPVVEDVGERPAAVAGDARHEWHALADQILDDDLRACQPARLERFHRPPRDGRCDAWVPCAGTMVDGIADPVTASGVDGILAEADHRRHPRALIGGRRTTAARRQPARADDRDHPDGHLERFLRGRRSRVRHQLRGDRCDRQPDHRHRRLAGLARRLARSRAGAGASPSRMERGRACLGGRRRDVRPGCAPARAGLRGCRRAQGPALRCRPIPRTSVLPRGCSARRPGSCRWHPTSS